MQLQTMFDVWYAVKVLESSAFIKVKCFVDQIHVAYRTLHRQVFWTNWISVF